MFNFYVSYSKKQIVISDKSPSTIKKAYDNQIELINSVKDRSAVDIVKERVLRNYRGYEVVENFKKPKYVMTPEHRAAVIRGVSKPKSEETKRKMSESKKGKPSNFKGKTHSYESRRMVAISKYGNSYKKDYVWAYNPDTDKEILVKSRQEIPEGYIEGRDYYSVESGLYKFLEHAKKKSRSSNSK